MPVTYDLLDSMQKSQYPCVQPGRLSKFKFKLGEMKMTGSSIRRVRTKSKGRPSALWFSGLLADQGVTQRDFAKAIKRNASAVSRLFGGDREWTYDDIVAFASLAKVDPADVYVQLGVEPAVNVKGSVAVAGSVAPDGTVTLGPVAAPRRVPVPPETPAGAVALRVKAGAAGAGGMDGWLFYYVDTGNRQADTGQLSVVRLGNKGGMRLGIIRRGYERGKWSIWPFIPGGAPLENVQLESAWPVLWVRTAV